MNASRRWVKGWAGSRKSMSPTESSKRFEPAQEALSPESIVPRPSKVSREASRPPFGCQCPCGSILAPLRNLAIRTSAVPLNLSIKNVPDHFGDLLRVRAAGNHRSMQGELLAILEEALLPRRSLTPAEALDRVRRLGLRRRDEATEMIRASMGISSPLRPRG